MVSVIVPVYNRKDLLQRCIVSLLGQTCSDYEIVLVDDGSADGSAELCDEYAKQYPQISVVHSTHVGPAGARNIGLDYAKGDLIMFCDSDDTVEPEWIEKLSACMTDPEIVLSVSSFYFVHNNDLQKKTVALENLEGGFTAKEYPFYFLAYHLNTIWHSCYRKTACRFHEDLFLGEDRIFNAEYICEQSQGLCDKIHYVDEHLYNYFSDVKGSQSKQVINERSYFECRVVCAKKYLEKYDYSADEVEAIDDLLKVDELGYKFRGYLQKKQYGKLKEVFNSPLWEKYVKQRNNAKTRWLLRKKSRLLLFLFNEIYLPLRRKTKRTSKK